MIDVTSELGERAFWLPEDTTTSGSYTVARLYISAADLSSNPW